LDAAAGNGISHENDGEYAGERGDETFSSREPAAVVDDEHDQHHLAGAAVADDEHVRCGQRRAGAQKKPAVACRGNPRVYRENERTVSEQQILREVVLEDDRGAVACILQQRHVLRQQACPPQV
jgi:hypothetical protein